MTNSTSSSAPSIYPYDASKALPIVFAVIIAILTIAILSQSIRYKWFHFFIVITWASSIWIAGFISRSLSSFYPSNVALYIMQYVLVFMGPPLYAASEYFILGRLLEYLPYHTPTHPGRVLSTFLLLSAAVESLTASGAATAASRKPNSYNSAITQIKASLILQEVVEMIFFSLVVLVEYRCRRARNFPRNVRIMCRILYVTSLMMTVRCIFRTIEGFETCDIFAPGFKGYCGVVQHYEWYLWVFEVANITVFILLLAIYHPGRYLPSNKKQYLDPVSPATERIGPGYSTADKRSWLTTVMDPFDFKGILTGKGGEVDKYWDRENPIAKECFASRKM